jgi:hypothetical protein
MKAQPLPLSSLVLCIAFQFLGLGAASAHSADNAEDSPQAVLNYEESGAKRQPALELRPSSYVDRPASVLFKHPAYKDSDSKGFNSPDGGNKVRPLYLYLYPKALIDNRLLHGIFEIFLRRPIGLLKHNYCR